VRKELIGLVSLYSLYELSKFGFGKAVRKQVIEQQGEACAYCGQVGSHSLQCHHVVPEKMLRRSGIKGNNSLKNAVGLCSHLDNDCHRYWDEKASHRVFFPGVELDQLDPDTYDKITPRPKRKSKGRRRRR